MPPLAAIRTAFRRSFDLSGRARRSEFWWFWGLHTAVPGLLGIALPALISERQPGVAQAMMAAGGLAYIVTVPGVFSALVRRIHDTGRSARLWAVLYAVLLAAVVVWFALPAVIAPAFPLTEELADALLTDGGFAAVVAASPLLMITGFMEILFFAMIVMLILAIALPILFVVVLALAVGLAAPTQPGPNRYGPEPEEG